MLLNEIILAKPIFEETQREKLPEGVLCRVTYPVCNIGERNANKRVYEKAVWDKVLADNDLKEKLENRALFGHAEHPEQTQSNLEKTSHVIFEMWIDKKDNKVYQKIDVLDTPTGRIVDTLLRANCQVGVSTRAEGDLEEGEDDEGTYQRVIPESYRYVTTDFTADPSTFGVIPLDVKRNIISTVGKEYRNEGADKSEREFARLLLEHMKCKKAAIAKCKKCGRCEALKLKKQYIAEGTWSYPYTEEKAKKLSGLLEKPLSAKEAKESLYSLMGDDTLFDRLDKAEESKASDVRSEVKASIKQMLEMYHKNPGGFKYGFEPKALEILHSIVEESEPKMKKENEETVKDLIADSTIKVGTKIKYGDQDAEVKEINEATVNLTVGVGKPTFVDVHGDASISVSPEGIITILPMETVEKLIPTPEAPKPELPPEEEKDRMAAAGSLPTEDGTPEEEEVEESKEVDEGFKTDLKNKDKKAVQQKIEAITDKLFAGEKLTRPESDYWDAYHAEVSKIRESVDERIVKKSDGYYVKSSKGKNLGGPYATKKEAEKRLADVEKFKHMKKESIEEKRTAVESKLKEILGIKVDTKIPIFESVENVSYVTVGKVVGRPCILVKFSKDRETLQGIIVTSDEEAISKGREIASVLEVEFKIPTKTESVKISEISKLMEEVQGELVDLRKVLGEEYLRGIEEKSVEPISTTTKEMVDLKVKEASTRAERDKALELLEELTSENQVANKDKALEAKMLVSRIRKILEAKEQEVNALRTKLEEKAKLASELKEKGTGLKEELDKVKINLVTDIRGLEGVAKATEERYTDEIKQLESKHVEEINQLIEKHNKDVEQLKSEFSTKILEGIEKTKKEVTSDFVKRFVALRLTESELKVDDNSRALLENCKSLEDVDDTFDEILDASRRGALHSNLLESIEIRRPVADPEQVEAERQVNNVFEGMGFIKKG